MLVCISRQTSNLAWKTDTPSMPLAEFKRLMGRMQSGGNEGHALQQAAVKNVFVTAGVGWQ